MAVDTPQVASIDVPAERRGVREALRAPHEVSAIRRDTYFRRSLAVGDVVATLVALLVPIGLPGAMPGVLLVALLAVAAAKTMGLYDRDQLVLSRRTLEEAPTLFQLATLLTLVTWLAQDLVAAAPFTHGGVIGVWILLALTLMLCRVAARRVATSLVPVERIMVVGEPDVHMRLRMKLALDERLKSEVVAYLPLLERRAAHGGPNPHEALEALVAEQNIHRVIVAPDGADHLTTQAVVTRAKGLGVNVSVLPRITEVVGSSVEFDELGGMTLLGVRPFGLPRSSAALKRTIDVLGAGFGILVIAPLLALVALAVRLDSRGPILFRQTRVGRDGEHFEIFKFRTMVPEADRVKAELAALSNGDGLFKVPGDPRVTRVGRFLRRTSLDELPQLWNVLRGDMSLVGPRPLIVEEDRNVVGHHRRRLHLKPGLTGPWQVLGSPGARVGLSEMVTIDYLYTANWSLWSDVQVVLRTVGYVLSGKGV